MLIYHRTSLFSSQAQTVVNTVNTVGVMGKGLASEFKKRYPAMFAVYKKLCDEGLFDIGQLWLWKGPDQWVLNFPTKKHWKAPSKLEYIEAGLKKFVENYEERGIREIAFPRLGCGNGGLEWDVVKPLMEKYLAPLPILIYIHDFEKNLGTPEHFPSLNALKFEKSFDTFIKHLRTVIHLKRGHFDTISKRMPYTASLSDDNTLVFEVNSKSITIAPDVLYELWVQSLKLPITQHEMPGARQAFYYIAPIMTLLPYFRLVEIARRDGTNAMAIELFLRNNTTQGTSQTRNAISQETFEWA